MTLTFRCLTKDVGCTRALVSERECVLSTNVRWPSLPPTAHSGLSPRASSAGVVTLENEQRRMGSGTGHPGLRPAAPGLAAGAPGWASARGITACLL